MHRAGLAGLLFALGPLAFAQSQSTFDFRSNFFVNLHHFLYEQAISKSPAPCDSKDWQRALEAYRGDIAKHELLSRDIAGINSSLAQLGDKQALKDAGLDAELTDLLERSAPVYRERWWPEHNRANLAWIASVEPLVARYEATLKKELSAAFQTPWPEERIRTDVSEYASWAGAYTLLEPTVITVSNGSRGPAALETLLHEASHALVREVSDALTRELESQNKLFARRAFWHAVLFYTVGHYTELEMEGYTQFGVKDGVLERGWPGALPILEKDWKPYLDGRIDLAAAVRRLVADYGVAK